MLIDLLLGALLLPALSTVTQSVTAFVIGPVFAAPDMVTVCTGTGAGSWECVQRPVARVKPESIPDGLADLEPINLP